MSEDALAESLKPFVVLEDVDPDFANRVGRQRRDLRFAATDTLFSVWSVITVPVAFGRPLTTSERVFLRVRQAEDWRTAVWEDQDFRQLLRHLKWREFRAAYVATHEYAPYYPD